MTTTTAKYVGPVETLKGCSVLVRPCAKADTVEVQFTSVNERSVDELVGAKDVSDLEQLMFGWHEMPKSHFEGTAKKNAAQSRRCD